MLIATFVRLLWIGEYRTKEIGKYSTYLLYIPVANKDNNKITNWKRLAEAESGRFTAKETQCQDLCSRH